MASQSSERRVCALCNRAGRRGFMRIGIDWVCTSAKACERRIRATGAIGIGTMRSYQR